MTAKEPVERQCIYFDNHGPLGLGSCKLTNFCFSGKLPVANCAKFTKRPRKKKNDKQ